jgi:hypothetical protein
VSPLGPRARAEAQRILDAAAQRLLEEQLERQRGEKAAEVEPPEWFWSSQEDDA